MATDIRQTILDELERQGRSRYWLAKHCDLNENTVYAFLRGDKDGAQPTIEQMLDALDLRIVPGETVKGGAMTTKKRTTRGKRPTRRRKSKTGRGGR